MRLFILGILGDIYSPGKPGRFRVPGVRGLLERTAERGLRGSPKLAVGDGALGLWKALSAVYPECRQQRCWVHKTLNVLNALPKRMQPKVKAALHEIWMAENQQEAGKAFDRTLRRFEAKYPKAMNCLNKDRERMLAFYDFPAEHWVSIRTTNPIESTFATVRLRSNRTRNCGSRDTTLAMVYKLMLSAQKRWRRINGFGKLELIANDVPFRDGVLIDDQHDRVAA